MVKIIEKFMWNLVSTSNLDMPNNAFDNPLLVRLCEIIRIIKNARQQIGVSKYEISVKFIKDELERAGDKVDESTVYRYIRKAMSSGLLSIESKTIVSYQQMDVASVFPGEKPSIHARDINGNDIPPSKLSQLSIYAEIGEITMKIYIVTNKGENLLNKFNFEMN